MTTNPFNPWHDQMAAQRVKERDDIIEECALVAESYDPGNPLWPRAIATAIRALKDKQ